MRTLILAALLATGLALPTSAPAMANDTMSQLGTGGLIFLTSGKVAMQSEDLFISMDEVRVAYEFRNDGETDETALVAFPLPDITGSGDFMVSIPTSSTDNIFGFTTTFNGASARLASITQRCCNRWSCRSRRSPPKRRRRSMRSPTPTRRCCCTMASSSRWNTTWAMACRPATCRSGR